MVAANKYLYSRPEKDTRIYVNQQRYAETGLERHRSHSPFTADELAATGGATSLSGSAINVLWCATESSSYPHGTQFAQVFLNVLGTPGVIWFQLPGSSPIAAPDPADIERCCCEAGGNHGPSHEPNHA